GGCRKRRPVRPWSRGRTIVLGVACLLMVTTSLLVPSAGATPTVVHAAGSCSTVDFIGARGSGQTVSQDSGLGPEVGAMNAQLRVALTPAGLSVETTPVEDGYSAESTNELKPS